MGIAMPAPSVMLLRDARAVIGRAMALLNARMGAPPDDDETSLPGDSATTLCEKPSRLYLQLSPYEHDPFAKFRQAISLFFFTLAEASLSESDPFDPLRLPLPLLPLQPPRPPPLPEPRLGVRERAPLSLFPYLWVQVQLSRSHLPLLARNNTPEVCNPLR